MPTPPRSSGFATGVPFSPSSTFSSTAQPLLPSTMESTASQQPYKPFHIAICGGGIGGLSLAVGLLNQSHKSPFSPSNPKFTIHIYEAASAFAEIGAGVTFAQNAIRAMMLIDPRIREGYERWATRPGSEEKKNVWFDFWWGMKSDVEGEAKVGVEGKECTSVNKEGAHIASVSYEKDTSGADVSHSSIHRAHFLDELIALLPDGIATFGKRVVSVDDQGEHGVTLSFADGTTAEADAVIGCDGVKSQVRKSLLGPEHPATYATFSGKYVYRELVPMDKAVEKLGDEMARNAQQYIGRHGHIVTYPIERGKTMNVVAHRDKEDGKWDDHRWVVPSKREDLFADFPGWGTMVENILSVSFSSPLVAYVRSPYLSSYRTQLMEKPDIYALFDHPSAPTFYKSRTCLLGDAAHATTPHQGAGAGQAIEDAFILSNLIGDITDVSEIEHAFQAYDAVRRPRTQKVVTMSRETGLLYDSEYPGIGDDIVKMGEMLRKAYRWIWDEDLGKQLESSRDIFSGVC